MKVLVVVQARIGSSRLPGKVLLPLSGKTVVERVVERIRAARIAFEVCVATTAALEDEPIRSLARRLGVRVFAGHPTDLLDRHYRAGLSAGADVVVKIPSDCPLIDPAVIEQVLGAYLEREREFDFVTNLYPASWPDGNDVEVMPMGVLATAHYEARGTFEREHTTPFIWQQPERFRIHNVQSSGIDLSSTHRFTLDYEDDYALIESVYEALFRPERPVFGLDEMLPFLARHPELLHKNVRYWGQTYASKQRFGSTALTNQQPGELT
jgi:spore coat polysaccharide biosynthesis protein SpsF